MKVLFLHPYPAGLAPSQRFRFEQYLSLLQAKGFQISRQSFWPSWAWKILYRRGHVLTKIAGLVTGFVRRLIILPAAARVDVVFIHRECTPVGPPFIEWVITKLLRKKAVFDFDDAIWLPNTSHENRLVSLLKWHRKVASICRWSTTISCGNPFLAAYALQWNKNVVVNPTTIDTQGLHVPLPSRKENTTVVFGWTGSHSTVGYLDNILPALLQITEKNNASLTVICDKKPSLGISHMNFVPWNKASEIQDLQTFDVGLMPLPDDIWAKGKCGLKILQYMALGIPTIASPVGVNRDMIKVGTTGLLASEMTEWLDAMQQLLSDQQLRMRMGSAARKFVEENYSVASNSETFLSLFR